MKTIKLKFIKGDRVIWIVYAIMCFASLLIVTSSTASLMYIKGNVTHYFFTHLKHLVLAFGAMLFFQYVSINWWRKWCAFITFITMAVLAFVALSGVVINSASRWLPVLNSTFQPSYVAKIMLVMVLAMQLDIRQKFISNMQLLPSFDPRDWQSQEGKDRNVLILVKNSMPILLPIAFICVMIVISNLSTALMIYLCSVFMLYVGRVRIKEIGKLLALTMVAGVLLFGLMAATGWGRVDTWTNRIKGFFVEEQEKVQIDKETGKEIKVKRQMSDLENQEFQAKVAIASGGVLGKGPGNSTQRTKLPLAYADFAYAFIIEEYGLVGAIVVLMMYLTIFYRCMIISRHSKSTFNSLVAFGLGLNILIQAAVNMCVSVSIIPVTGQSLPILSLGGSSLLITGLSLGIIQSIARQNDLDTISEEGSNGELKAA